MIKRFVPQHFIDNFHEIKKKNYIKSTGFIMFADLSGFTAMSEKLSKKADGSTIATAKLLGIDKESAAKYSFLLSIPAITGAFLLKVKDIFSESIELDYTLLIVGFLASFLSGYYSLKLLIWLIKKANLRLFIVYCLVVGSTVIYYGLNQ